MLVARHFADLERGPGSFDVEKERVGHGEPIGCIGSPAIVALHLSPVEVCLHPTAEWRVDLSRCAMDVLCRHGSR